MSEFKAAKVYFENQYGERHIRNVMGMQDLMSLYGLIDEYAEHRVKHSVNAGLLEALQECRSVLEWVMEKMKPIDSNDQSDSFNLPANAILQAEQAILKATNNV